MGYAIIDISSGNELEGTKAETDEITTKPDEEKINDERGVIIEEILPDGHVIERRKRKEDAIRNEVFKQSQEATQV